MSAISYTSLSFDDVVLVTSCNVLLWRSHGQCFGYLLQIFVAVACSLYCI